MGRYRKIMEGPHCEVRIESEAYKTLKGAESHHRRRIERILEQICRDGGTALSPQHLKHEGRFSDGSKQGTRATVYALKAYQLRIYGGYVGGCFYCCEAAIKKQDKANKKQLKRVAETLGELNEKG